MESETDVSQNLEIDEAVGKVSGYKRWNLLVFILVGMTTCLPIASQGLIIVFIGWTPPHHCKVPDGVAINETIPVDSKGEYKKCVMYANDTSYPRKTQACNDGWTYYDNGERSMTMEWDLVCDKGYLSELSQTLYQAGALASELTGSVLIDKLGRKWTHIVGSLSVAVLGSGLAFTQSYVAFAILRICVAYFVVLALLSGLTLLMEIFDSNHRAFVGIGIEGHWTVCYMLVALFGYIFQDWRHLQFAISALSVISFPLIWLIPDSPMWLVAQGRVQEAEETLQKMARMNGIKVEGTLLKLEEDILLSKKDEVVTCSGEIVRIKRKSTILTSEEKIEIVVEKETLKDLFVDPLLRKYTIISIFLWFANNIVYYFLILSAPALGGSHYINILLGGLVEIPAYIISYYVIRLGRRIPTCVFHIMSGICLIAIGFTPSKTSSGTDLSTLIMIIALAGKFSISGSFAIVVLYTREYVPTNLRGTSGGVCNVLGRVGNMVAPFAAYAAKETPWIPNLILGIISIAVALMTLLLPETKDWPLPQTLNDVHLFSQGQYPTESTDENKNKKQGSNEHISTI